MTFRFSSATLGSKKLGSQLKVAQFFFRQIFQEETILQDGFLEGQLISYGGQCAGCFL